MSDFIADVQALFANEISPEIFKLWCGISLVAGAMERRVWSKNFKGTTYASMYVLLVAPPGTGKGIISTVRRLWTKATKTGTKIPAFHVAPSSMTKAALIDTLAASKATFVPPKGMPYNYSTLNIASEEFSVLVPSYDMEYIGTLNGIWNNEDLHDEARRYSKTPNLKIENPQLNIIAGTQPSYMASLLPEEAWNTGLARRLIMIYSAEKVKYDLFAEAPDRDESQRRVLARLGEMSQLWGEIVWEAEAIAGFREWVAGGEEPLPSHAKLVHYTTTRQQYVFKLAMVSSVCQGNSLRITGEDFMRALSWLLMAERLMPDVFRAMIGKSDKDVLGELHAFAMAAAARSREKTVDGQLLRRFLIERVPHEKVETILGAADRAGLVSRIVSGDGSDRWMPKGRTGMGGME